MNSRAPVIITVTSDQELVGLTHVAAMTRTVGAAVGNVTHRLLHSN